jgi:hypothetical protein
MMTVRSRFFAGDFREINETFLGGMGQDWKMWDTGGANEPE